MLEYFAKMPLWGVKICTFLDMKDTIAKLCRFNLSLGKQLSHKGRMRGCYLYEIERKKGSYFPILGFIVVINQAIEFLETYGLLRN